MLCDHGLNRKTLLRSVMSHNCCRNRRVPGGHAGLPGSVRLQSLLGFVSFPAEARSSLNGDNEDASVPCISHAGWKTSQESCKMCSGLSY